MAARAGNLEDDGEAFPQGGASGAARARARASMEEEALAALAQWKARCMPSRWR